WRRRERRDGFAGSKLRDTPLGPLYEKSRFHDLVFRSGDHPNRNASRWAVYFSHERVLCPHAEKSTSRGIGALAWSRIALGIRMEQTEDCQDATPGVDSVRK